MTARLLDGRAAAQAVRATIAGAVRHRVERGLPAPALATVLAGDDPASVWYVGSIARQARGAGMTARDVRVDPKHGDPALRETLLKLNADPTIHGVIVMLPLPEPLSAATAVETLDPAKDVDGITTTSMGRLALGQPGLVPCTPAGGIELLKHYEVPLAGAEAVIVGRSNIVGKPLALMLLAEHATVTVCHTRTRDRAEVCRRADILCAATGRPGLITADMVKPGAAVLDFGTTPSPTGTLRGDVDFPGVSEVAGWVSPMPGGTETMTTAVLLRNTLRAAELQADR